jgi:hypothetical protein
MNTPRFFKKQSCIEIFLFFIYFKLIFLDYFDVLILKIILKKIKKNIILIHF